MQCWALLCQPYSAANGMRRHMAACAGDYRQRHSLGVAAIHVVSHSLGAGGVPQGLNLLERLPLRFGYDGIDGDQRRNTDGRKCVVGGYRWEGGSRQLYTLSSRPPSSSTESHQDHRSPACPNVSWMLGSSRETMKLLPKLVRVASAMAWPLQVGSGGRGERVAPAQHGAESRQQRVGRGYERRVRRRLWCNQVACGQVVTHLTLRGNTSPHSSQLMGPNDICRVDQEQGVCKKRGQAEQ